ncbi:MAG: murein biosynthesis integral membrane protein MurJ [Anaeromyxobacter sp. RBG_16_69_14]|nr:MAG: murein biosynthesis integral membrane protein MurJ [Anaeromyxobacter sp. RBG_16_69_14]
MSTPPMSPAPVRMGRALWISAATMASRVLGLVREQVFAALLGAGQFTDAFVTAFRISNLLRDLFAEGALSAGFVPTFADYDRNRGRAEAWRLANAVVGLVLIVVGAITLLGIAFAPQLVRFMAPGYAPEQVVLTVKLARIMMPFLLLVSLAAVAMGMLNAQARFTAPALAPALFNVATIAVGAFLWTLGFGPRTAVIGWSVGTLLGGVFQLMAQVPSLWRLGYRPRPIISAASLREPGIRRIGRVVGAATIGLSAVQVNIFVSNIFASHEVGAVSWLNYAFRLMQLPLGVFGVAIATVAGAGVAQRAAAKDLAGARETLGAAMRLVAFLNVPSAVGLMVLAHPIIGLIYEHRAFRAADTVSTAQALVCYAIGLYGYSAVKVLAPAFYALDEARVPVMGSLLGMACNVALNLTLYPILGFRGVALGTSLAATVNFAVLAIAWKRMHGGLGGAGIYRHLLRVLCASAVLALVAWGALQGLSQVLPQRGLVRQLALALGPIALAAAAYLAAGRALGMRELDDVLRALRRRRAGAR